MLKCKKKKIWSTKKVKDNRVGKKKKSRKLDKKQRLQFLNKVKRERFQTNTIHIKMEKFVKAFCSTQLSRDKDKHFIFYFFFTF